MAYPQVAATSKNSTAAGATHAITLPSGIVAGQLLIIFFSTDGDNTVTNWDGFTEIFSTSNGTAASLHIGWKIAAGSDTCTLTVSVTNEPGSHICYRITGHDSGQAPEASTGVATSSQFPAPDELTPTGGTKDFLWIGVEGNDHTDVVTVYPSDLTDNRDNQSEGSNGGCGVGVASVEVNASVYDPSGTFTLTGAEQWVACTVAVHPASISQVTLAGVSNGSSVAAGAKKKIASFGGIAQGATSVLGALILIAGLLGASIGGSTTSGSIQAIRELAGSSGGTSTVTGSLSKIASFAGVSSGSSTATGAISVPRIYYVSQVDGNDGYNGLYLTFQGGSDGPWLTISKADDLSSDQSDKSVLFRRDGEWREQYAIGCFGTSGHPFTIGAYDSGADPIINGSSIETTWEPTGGTDLSEDANLLALWYMEDATGATRLDETDNDVDLADSNTVVQHATHVQGTYATAFTATSSMQLNAADAILPATWPHSSGASDTDYTMGGWFRVNNVSADHSLMSKGWRANLYVCSAENYKPRYKVLNAASGVGYVLANAAITANTWTHIAVVVDLTAETCTMYIDGIAQNDVLSIADLDEDADPFEIGDSVDKAYLDGYADECFMFDRALDAAEVLAIKNDFVDGSGGGPANIYSKTFTNEPRVIVEDGTLLTLVDWDTDLATTAAAMSAGTFAVDIGDNTAYVWCTDDADPDTHTMEVSAETGDAGLVIKCRDVSYITFDGLDITQGTSNNINVDSLEGVDVSNIIVQNCTLRYAGQSGITFTNWANLDAGHPITDCLVYNCESYYNRQHGVSNTYHCTSCTISTNITHHNGWGGVNAATGGHGITSWSNDADSYPDGLIIEYNTSYNNYVESTGDTEGTGIQLDDLTRNSIVRYNISYDNEGAGLIDNGTQNSEWYYNIVYGNGTSTGQGGFWLLNTTVGCVIYNNVFYNNLMGLYMNNSVANVTVKNNIFSENTSAQEIEIAAGSTTGHDIDYNCVYHSGGGTFMDWGGTDYNWADWLTNSGQDANSLNEDPLMTDPGNDDFTLKSSSPCIDEGTDVGLTEDYWGTAVPQQTDPCIGVHEHTGRIDFAGTSDGAATTSAGIQKIGQFVGASTGQSTASGAIQAIKSLNGSSGGIATIAAKLSPIRDLTGVADGIATVSGDVTVIGVAAVTFAGTSDGTSTATGNLSVVKELIGVSDGSSTANAILSPNRGLAGLSAGNSTATGILEAIKSLLGQSDGQAIVSGTLQAIKELEGQSTGQSDAIGDLSTEGTITFIGVSSGSSTVTGSIQAIKSIVGQSSGQATASGSLQAIKELEGLSAGQGNASAILLKVKTLAGIPGGSSTANAEIQAIKELRGLSGGQGGITADLTVKGTVTFTGISSGSSTVTSALSATKEFQGSSDGLSTIDAALTKIFYFAGQSNGQATADAILNLISSLSGLSQGSSTVAGFIQAIYELIGQSSGQGNATADLSIIYSTAPVYLDSFIKRDAIGLNSRINNESLLKSTLSTDSDGGIEV